MLIKHPKYVYVFHAWSQYRAINTRLKINVLFRNTWFLAPVGTHGAYVTLPTPI